MTNATAHKTFGPDNPVGYHVVYQGRLYDVTGVAPYTAGHGVRLRHFNGEAGPVAMRLECEWLERTYEGAA